MNTDNLNDENLMHDDASQRAVSIYGRNDSVEDFPVLKAFQQYIDAEQEKARKRILGLGIVFGVVLVLVIVVFMVLLHGINVRNQLLSDRLVNYALNESNRRQSAEPAATNGAQHDAALKAMTDTLLSFQKQMLENNRPSDSSRLETDSQTRAEDEKLQRAKALLAAERQRLAVEKERLHQIEIEQQRRKLYPELYRDEDREYVPYNAKKTRTRTRTLTDEDIREIIREAYPESEAKASSAEEATTKSSDSGKRHTESDKDNAEQDDAIEYFKDDDYTIPIDVKGKSSKVKFTVPVD